MTYYSDLGFLNLVDKMKDKLKEAQVAAKAPAKPRATNTTDTSNMVWVDDGNGKGHWERKKATSGRTAAVTKMSANYIKCRDTGMPAALISVCEEGLKSGATLEQVVEELQKLPPEQVSALEQVHAQQNASTGGGSKLILYGGIAGALALVYIIRRKK